MLFDLRGRGRRRTVQAIYLTLAILMGGGLVLFGIGSDQQGGLVEGLVGDGSGSGDTSTETLDKRIKAELAKARRTPRNPTVWAELARLQYQRANLDGRNAADTGYTTKGKARLQLAANAWERHLDLDPKQPSARVARIMVLAYDTNALAQPVQAVRAMEVVTAAEDPPNANLYGQLARLAYQAGDARTGDLAADRAVDLAPDEQKKLLRTELDRLKKQGSAPAQATPVPSS